MADSEKGKLQSLKLYQLLMLASCMIGNEGAAVFGQIYTLLILEYLGVPTSLATANGFIGGGSAVFVIPVCGVWMDKGNNPRRRKLVGMVLGTILFLSSFVVLFITAFLKNNEFQATTHFNTSTSLMVNESDDGIPIMQRNASAGIDVNHVAYDRTLPSPFPMEDLESTDTTLMPLTGVLGIVAFSLLDLGFDLGNFYTRAFALDHTPPEQQNTILMIVSILAPAAGVTISVFGIFDISGALASAFNGDGTAILVMFFSILLIVVVTTTMLCTIMTGLWVTSKTCMLDHPDGSSNGDIVLYIAEDTFEDKSDKTVPCKGQSEESRLICDRKTPKSTYTGKIRDQISKEDKIGNVEIDSYHFQEQQSTFFTKRLVILLMATYASMFCMVNFSMFHANVVTVGVYHGDPLALPGTEANHWYTKGLRTAAMGSTVFYLSYVITSIVNKRLISVAGEKTLFLGTQLLHAVVTFMFVLWPRVEMYYAAMATFGPSRWSLFTIPYMIANKFTNDSMHASNADEQGLLSKAGRVVSLISVIGPINYMSVSASMGPLLAVTGNVWLPMELSAIGAFASTILTLPLYFVK